MKSQVLLFYGGWEGHEPEAFAHFLADQLRVRGMEVDLQPDLTGLEDYDQLAGYDLIIPCWTMGTLSSEASKALSQAVAAGTGLAGIHGGMGDAFRGNLNYEWLVGGHFVGHPHVGRYEVRITDPNHPATRGLPNVFSYDSEQYYLLVDPDVRVLAETDYSFQGRVVRMPVAWSRNWHKGRVFYSALGHAVDEYRSSPEALNLALQGMDWAAGKFHSE